MSSFKLAKNIGIMSISVFLSRILGLFRDQVMAFFFGTTYLNDAFNVAYNLPNLLRRLFGEGALSAAFVPMYNEIGIVKGKQEQINFALNVLSILTLFLTILTFLGVSLAPIIIKVLYPGLPPDTLLVAVKLSRIIFPYLFFIGLSSTLIAILNSHDYFFMTGLSSALLNIGMISTIILPYFVYSISGVDLVVWAGWGVIIGGIFQTIINFPYLKAIGYKFRLFFQYSRSSLSALLKRFLPAMIGIGIREINLITDALMASFLPVGSITSLGLGNRLMQMPLGIFGISTGTAILPMYAKHITEKNWKQLSESLRFATISLSAIMITITSLICGLGHDYVRILFQRGVFNANASIMTYQALFFYSLGLIFYSLNQTITPLFYANKDTKTPVKIAAYMVALNICLNFILMQFIQHRGLALSTSLTAMINYIFLLKVIKRSIPEVKLIGTFTQICKILIINAILLTILITINTLFKQLSYSFLILKVTIMTILYLALFIILAYLAKLNYLIKIKQFIWLKINKKS